MKFFKLPPTHRLRTLCLPLPLAPQGGSVRAIALLKFAIILSLGMCVSSCGFSPVYHKGVVREELQNVAIFAPDNREAQMLKAALEDAIYAGDAKEAKYTLIPNLGLSVLPLSIEANGTTQRYRVIGVANYQLLGAGGAVVNQGAFERFSSYSIASADYSTYVAGKDAKKQVIEAVAEELRLRLIDYFNKAHIK